jgi:DNA (cytosine-5)-methyltransferase 1
MSAQLGFAFGHELIVDLFAGGGGASEGIKQAFGRDPDVAVNHDAIAVSVHEANHPTTMHFRRDVFEVAPRDVTQGRPIGLLWASPDCKHFSKAKGGKPVSKKIRGLAWVVVRWAKEARPRVIVLENVEEFVTWGPLVNDRPCPERKGQTFRRWVGDLRRLGYKVEHRELRACDYGAPTSRKRFFLIARCDGLQITWPKPTHGKGLLPYRTAADCIDFSLPCPSIFLTKDEARAIGVKRPLAEATMRRIWKGVHRFVLNCAKPFIVPITHHGDRRGHPIDEPLPTITAAHRGELAYVAPLMVPRYGERPTQDPRALQVDAPMPTVVPTGNGGSLVSAFLTKYREDSSGASAEQPFPTITANSFEDRPGGNPPLALVSTFMEQANTDVVGHDMRTPVSTIVGKGCTQRLAAVHLSKLYGTSTGADPREPAPTVTATGNHIAEVRAFLVAYYGNEKDGRDLREPMGTVVSRERFGLVTVDGTEYEIADIGLRMLTPRELFRAQGFPESYVIDRGADGKKLPKDAQVRLCGNSVCPPIARAIVAANCGRIIAHERQAAVA